MRTRLVRVRRERPSGVVWAVALMLFSLALYLITSAPAVKSTLGSGSVAQSTEAPGTVEPKTTTGVRVTREIQFDALNYYLIQFGAFDSAENARIEAARYVKRGAAGYVLNDGMYRVIGAGYQTPGEAERVKEKLLEQEKMNCVVYAVESGRVTLRVTATEAQINALERAQRILREQTDALGEMAFRIDGGELRVEDARAELASACADVTAACAELTRLSGETPNDVASGLITLLRSFEAELSRLMQENDASTLSFSSKIKYNTIDTRLRHVEYMRMLQA